MKKLLELVFKYVVDGKAIRIKRNADNVITGYSFRSLMFDDLLADVEIQTAIAENQDGGDFNIRYGKKGDTFLDDKKVIQSCKADFFYVGYDTRTDYTSASDLLSVE
jgi:hypothetical protein